ncbi:MAG: hypothetical protein A3G42_05940 [Gammaproteobacteria bacterium RIFCSPLOWO2_12_FULL_47_76]|nr:MAG: hypothetical protein A3G42_05940 [Gammaproteobacteria bacterium RIFCSPLOWO2_12_FULL_47_76]
MQGPFKMFIQKIQELHEDVMNHFMNVPAIAVNQIFYHPDISSGQNNTFNINAFVTILMSR